FFFHIDSSPTQTATLSLHDALPISMAGQFGSKLGIAPRIFLKKLVADVLDRVELHPDFNPREHYKLTIKKEELDAEERQAVYGRDRKSTRLNSRSRFDLVCRLLLEK